MCRKVCPMLANYCCCCCMEMEGEEHTFKSITIKGSSSRDWPAHVSPNRATSITEAETAMRRLFSALQRSASYRDPNSRLVSKVVPIRLLVHVHTFHMPWAYIKGSVEVPIDWWMGRLRLFFLIPISFQFLFLMRDFNQSSADGIPISSRRLQRITWEGKEGSVLNFKALSPGSCLSARGTSLHHSSIFWRKSLIENLCFESHEQKAPFSLLGRKDMIDKTSLWSSILESSSFLRLRFPTPPPKDEPLNHLKKDYENSTTRPTEILTPFKRLISGSTLARTTFAHVILHYLLST